MFYLKFTIMDVSFKYFTGVDMISFDDQSYRTQIDVFPYIDLIGNFW